MYDAYERFWHWLQTITIVLLLFTGLIIHRPDIFGAFSFPYVVTVHNVLAFILVVNAALSLFWHLVSGEIRSSSRARTASSTIDHAAALSRGHLQGQRTSV
jgi:Ni,Fe-hydrogenase I cytochrome b subunit